MKTLSFQEMEKIEGKQGALDGLTYGCIGVSLLGLAGSVFTFGAALAFGATVAGAVCAGAAIGAVVPVGGGGSSHGASGSW